MVAMVNAGAWWNPFAWLEKIGDLGSDIVSDIENWVEDAVNWAFSIYDAAAQLTMDAVNDGIGYIFDAMSIVTSELTNIYDSLNNILGPWITRIISDVESAADSLVNAAINLATDALNTAVSFISSVIQAVINTATATFDDFIAPAFEWVGNAENWLIERLESFGATLISAVHSLYDDALSDIEQGLSEVVGLVGGEVMTVVHAVEAAWDWILWFGEHAIEDFIDIPGDLESFAHLSSARSFASDIGGSVDWVESVITDFMGS
jgi:phage-related protein